MSSDAPPGVIAAKPLSLRTLTLYRDDSTVAVEYRDVKHFFWTAGGSMLTIAQVTGEGGAHRYLHWPRERFCWFKDERQT